MNRLRRHHIHPPNCNRKLQRRRNEYNFWIISPIVWLRKFTGKMEMCIHRLRFDQNAEQQQIHIISSRMPCVRVFEPCNLCHIQFDRIRLEGSIIRNLESLANACNFKLLLLFHRRSPIKRFNFTRCAVWLCACLCVRAYKTKKVNGWTAFALAPNSRPTEFRINSEIYDDIFCENVVHASDEQNNFSPLLAVSFVPFEQHLES